MPIRTHRGRAAVYRRLWGWPLRSPAHLIGTAIMVVAIVVAAGIVLPRLLGGPGDAGAASPTTTETSAGSGETRPGSGDTLSTSALPTRLSEPLASPTTAPPAPAALDVAKKWASAWVKHPKGITSEQWLNGLRPYTTEEYLPVMRSVNPANIPATKVTGEPRAAASYTSSVEAHVPTDGPSLSITVVRTDAGWRVAHYDQVG
ncbi:hypothetical protein [Prauserella muralis]|uniref:Uncharacterized protein n=1 Tax=Prauserella muralis TaxID=588067 RepID=A0A2V4BB54_9PSEU|nr:hypothetical protein [Prauserella muralis]PXY32518.1 hypothetical protein BAY60_09715 [Prauserella muralis]TWE23776.1 hypothetical protein FHX69_5076 [Prauserella muralis]